MAVQFVDNPYDGHTLTEQLEQVAILTEDIGVPPKAVMVDLGFRGGRCRQSGREDHSPGQIQEPGRSAAPLAQA